MTIMNRYKSAKKTSIIGMFGNAFLFIIKIIIAIITSSKAMMADAFNSLSDIFSSIMTFVGNKISSKPKDDDHNLGHGKAEYIYSLLISNLMIYLGINVLLSSGKSLVLHKNIEYSKWLVIVSIITLIVKLILFIYTSIEAKKFNNVLVKANSKDHFNDMFITMLTLVSTIFSYYHLYYIDFISGLIIAIVIIISGLKIFKESYDVLMDKSIDIKEKEMVLKIVGKYKEIKKINHFNSTPVGYKYQISLTIFVDGKLSTYESHKIANDLEKDIIKSVPSIFLAVIHVNPL